MGTEIQNQLTISDLSFSYGKKIVLENVNLSVKNGDFLAIIGPNGGGKTTLLKIVLGLLKGYAGQVNVTCHLKDRSQADRHRCMGYVPQRTSANFSFPASLYDTVQMGLYGFTGIRGPSKSDKDYIAWLLNELGIFDIRNNHVSALSGGQLQRAFIARALVTRPSLLLMDEPLIGIDRTGISRFLELLLKIKEGLSLTVIMVTHDLEAVSVCADKIACLNRTVHYHDNPGKLKGEDIYRTFSCSFESFVHMEDHIEGQLNA